LSRKKTKKLEKSILNKKLQKADLYSLPYLSIKILW